MIVWQGYGFLAVVIPLIVFVLAGIINSGRAEATDAMMAAMFFISAILVWMVGKKLNNKPGKILVDPETQEKLEFKDKHTLFWIPMEWIAIAWVGMAVFSLVQ